MIKISKIAVEFILFALTCLNTHITKANVAKKDVKNVQRTVMEPNLQSHTRLELTENVDSFSGCDIFHIHSYFSYSQ